jgi:hypothetical protein
MPWVGFEPTIPVFERAKIFDALELAAAVIGQCSVSKLKSVNTVDGLAIFAQEINKK